VSETPTAIHIHPTAPLAPRVLLPGDPGRALALATELLADPRMFHHNRGLWGYTGVAADGAPLTIQSTGMGGPSAAIVLEELIALGATRAIRVGTAGALDPALRHGELFVAVEAICEDGTSRALGAGERATADTELTAALRAAAPAAPAGTIVTSDLFYEVGTPRFEHWRDLGARAVEMEAAALFAVGRLRGVAVGCALAITDLLGGGRERIDAAALHAAGIAVGRLGAAAL
jgi:uridine phosphorylase